MESEERLGGLCHAIGIAGNCPNCCSCCEAIPPDDMLDNPEYLCEECKATFQGKATFRGKERTERKRIKV